ncbi:unnamed protein product [Rotaria socialis]
MSSFFRSILLNVDSLKVVEFSILFIAMPTALVNDVLFIVLSTVVLSSLIKEKAKFDIDGSIVFLKQVISLIE